MYVIRETFTAKPGQASALARLFKDVMAEFPQFKTRVLTDYIGTFNTVVMETEVNDLAAFDHMMAEYAAREDVRIRMRAYVDMYITGGREVYRVV